MNESYSGIPDGADVLDTMELGTGQTTDRGLNRNPIGSRFRSAWIRVCIYGETNKQITIGGVEALVRVLTMEH